MPLIATKGYAAPEVEQVYSRAAGFVPASRRAGTALSSAAWAMAVYFVRGELQTRAGIGEQLLALAQRVQDRRLPPGSPPSPGTTLLFLESWPLRGHTWRRAHPVRHRAASVSDLPLGQDSKVTAWAIRPGPCGFWAILTRPGRESRDADAGQELSQSLHPRFCSYWAACVHRFRREWLLLHSALKR